MNDNKLLAIFWVCLAAVLISLIGAVTLYNVTEIAAASSAADPALYQCSLSERQANTPFCVGLLQR